MSISVGDLFCGAGGFSTGASSIGWTPKWGVDNDEDAITVWRENHAGTAFQGDLTQPSVQSYVQNELASVDVLIGGPPCKDFSKSNRVIDKGRNNLVLVFMDYVDLLDPDAFIIENVRQLETQYDEILDTVYEIANERSYAVNHRTLNAADYGVAQNRVRTFIIGIKEYADTPNFPRPTHGDKSPTENPPVSAAEAIADVPPPNEDDAVQITSKYADIVPEIPPGLNYAYYTERLGHPDPKFEWRSRFSDFLYKANPEEPVRTIKAKPGASSGPFHWENRRFTIKEQAALQSFPSDFSFSTSQTAAQKLVGNAVPPKLAQAVCDAVNKQAFNNQLQYIPSLLSEDEDLEIIARRRTSTETYKAMAEQKINEKYNEN